MLKKIILLTTVSVMLTNCGVIFGGSKYEGTIIAKNHPNAEIYVNGENLGKGQVTKLFPRNKSLEVELKQEGCEPKTQNFDKVARVPNIILSTLTWGIVGLGVDFGTGASYKPDHRNNTSIEKKNDKKYTFNIDYSDCK